MKKLLFILFVLLGCTRECDCTYYSAEKINNGPWEVKYESDWDATCKSEELSNDIYYASNGDIWYSKTYVVCN